MCVCLLGSTYMETGHGRLHMFYDEKTTDFNYSAITWDWEQGKRFKNLAWTTHATTKK